MKNFLFFLFGLFAIMLNFATEVAAKAPPDSIFKIEPASVNHQNSDLFLYWDCPEKHEYLCSSAVFFVSNYLMPRNEKALKHYSQLGYSIAYSTNSRK